MHHPFWDRSTGKSDGVPFLPCVLPSIQVARVLNWHTTYDNNYKVHDTTQTHTHMPNAVINGREFSLNTPFDYYLYGMKNSLLYNICI